MSERARMRRVKHPQPVIYGQPVSTIMLRTMHQGWGSLDIALVRSSVFLPKQLRSIKHAKKFLGTLPKPVLHRILTYL